MVVFLLKLLSRLPLWVLYFVADFIYLLLKLIGYRKKVVVGNLSKSFPEKTPSEIREITHRFYRSFANFLVETLKGFTISEATLTKRVKFTNLEILDEFVEKEQSFICFVAHQFNWEWALQAGSLQLPMPLDGIYQKLANPVFDKLVLDTRSRFGATLIERSDARKMVNRRKIFSGLAIIADQVPQASLITDRHWTNFFNQETAFFMGGEKIAKLLNLPTLFMNIQSPKQGYYEITLEKLTEPPYSKELGEITEAYARATERLISQQPENWLWSHKRWKYTRSHPIMVRQEQARKR